MRGTHTGRFPLAFSVMIACVTRRVPHTVVESDKRSDRQVKISKMGWDGLGMTLVTSLIEFIVLSMVDYPRAPAGRPSPLLLKGLGCLGLETPHYTTIYATSGPL